MQATATSEVTSVHADIPTARIDAQDEPSVLPIREYLETHGVRVFMNKAPGVAVMYHVVMGDGVFVKEIYSRIRKGKEKRLAITVGHTGADPEPGLYGSKIIFIDPKDLSHDSVTDIFEFFFTSDKKSIDKRTERTSRIIHEKPIAAPRHESPPTIHDEERIGSIIADVFGDSAKPEVKKHEEHAKRKRKKRRQWILGLLIGFGVIIIPIIWYVLSISISGTALYFSARSMTDGNVQAVRWQSRLASYWIKQGSMLLRIASVPLTWVGMQGSIRGQERLVSFISDGAMASDQVQTMLGVGQTVASGLLNQVSVGTTGITPAADITTLRTSLDSVQNTLGLAQAELELLLKDRTFPFSVPVVAGEGSRIISRLVTLRDSAANMDELVSLFLQLAGFKEQKTYLVLLQNSTELRPTGGFIGSVAIASFENGRMTDLQVQDVYTFDGQLKGHVDPPVPVRELLGQEHWYLRDSNWDPDFSVSAAKAAWFYQKETGNSVDGVFAINTPFIIDILKATGPVELSDYNDRITADNFYGKSLYYTQNDFFPGSTQKKDFLGTLMRALISKVTTSQTTNIPALFQAMTNALSGHDLLMMFSPSDIQSVISHFGWAGRVPSVSGCSGVEASTCSFDPLITVEANMGTNKVNYFVTRSLDRNITVNPDGSIHETTTITMKNTDGQNSGLAYRTYVRFLLPVNVAVAGVTIDGAPVPSRTDSSKLPVLPYLERTDLTSGSYTLGVGFELPAGTEKQLTISYTRDAVVHFGESGGVLDLFLQKQPGVSGTPVHTVLTYPVAWIAGVEEGNSGTVAQDFIANAGQLEYNTVLDRDSITRIRFTK